MTIALGNHTKMTGAGGTTPSIDTTGASLLVIAIAASNSSPPSPNDSKSNTWTALTRQPGSFGGIQLFYAANPIVGTGHTFTTGGTSTALCAAAFTGVLTVSPFDVQSGGAVTATTSVQPGSITPSVSGELVIGAYEIGATRTVTADSGMVAIETAPFASGVNYGGALYYVVQSSAAAINPTYSWVTNTDATAVSASFKAAGGPTGRLFRASGLDGLGGVGSINFNPVL